MPNDTLAIHPEVYAAHAQRYRRFIQSATVAAWRPIDQFAEEEITLPTGPYEGYSFRLDRQPFARLFFNEVNRQAWTEIAATGPSQSGKTLICFCIPIMWHVFERRESIIVAAPDEDICKEKWLRDLLPVIKATKYRKYLPQSGPGARGGFGELMQFGNGGSIKWMTGGGDDKSRAHYTARVIVMTEVDGMATTATTSQEADKVTQIEARANAFGDSRIVYKECTVSVPDGHIWQTYTRGTASKIMTPCPHCSAYVCLTRDNLSGWEESDTDVSAKRNAVFACSSCGEHWSEDDRRQANLNAILLHDGQSIEDGKIIGEQKETFTLGFRWTSANNLLVPISHVAVEEWKGKRAHDTENAEKKMQQFFWAEPYDNPNLEITRIDPTSIQRRQGSWPRGYIPEGAKWITVGCDVGKRLLYFTCMATFTDGRRHIFDYGRLEVPSDDMGIEVALPLALRELRELCNNGWTDSTGSLQPATEIWVDAGAWTETIVAFIKDPETDSGRYRPSFGRGFGQQRRVWYNKPKKTGGIVKSIGSEYHFTLHAHHRVFHVEFNADYYKSMLHQGLLLTDKTQPGTVTLFQAVPKEHTSFSAHLSAEHQQQEFIPEKGTQIVWRAHSRNNHWLDSTNLALVASQFCMEFRNVTPTKANQKETKREEHVKRRKPWG